MAHGIEDFPSLLFRPNQDNITGHVGRQHRQFAGQQPHRAFSDDYAAIGKLFEGVVWKIENKLRLSEYVLDAFVDRGTIVCSPLDDPVKRSVKL